MNTEELDTVAWYRQFWPWFLIALPATAVVASFTTLFIAVNNAPELVIDDYTRIAEISAAQMQRDSRARELGLQASLTFSESRDPGKQLVAVILTGNDSAGLPETLVLKSKHSTLANLDSTTELTGGSGHYAGTIPVLSGAYDIHLEDPSQTWKLSVRATGQPVSLKLNSLEQVKK